MKRNTLLILLTLGVLLSIACGMTAAALSDPPKSENASDYSLNFNDDEDNPICNSKYTVNLKFLSRNDDQSVNVRLTIDGEYIDLPVQRTNYLKGILFANFSTPAGGTVEVWCPD